MRIVHYRSMDFTRLAAVDRLIRGVRTKMMTPTLARETLNKMGKYVVKEISKLK